MEANFYLRKSKRALGMALLGVSLWSAPAPAATAVIPPEYEFEVGGGSGGPFTGSGYRFQAIYNADQFAPLMPQGGEIREIAFRLDQSIPTRCRAFRCE